MGDISRLTIIFAVAVLLQQELLGSRVLAQYEDLGDTCDTNNDCGDNDPTMICVFHECRCAPGYSTDNQNPFECQGCGRNLTGSTGTFTSPNHPDEYPWGGDCRWHITVPPGMFIWLSFSQFAIERDIDNCTYQDTVSVYDSSTVSANSLLAKLCGVDAPGNYTSTNNVMTVRLTMNSEDSEDGFVASYISFPAPLGEPCGNDNHCGDNELTEICQNSTCVCAPGYTQEGSECTEEVSVESSTTEEPSTTTLEGIVDNAFPDCEMKTLTYQEATNPALAAPVVYMMSGSMPSIDANHEPIDGADGSGREYYPGKNVSDPSITYTFLNSEEKVKVVMFEMKVTRTEKVTVVAMDKSGVETYNYEIPNVSSNADLDAWTPVNGFFNFTLPEAGTLEFIFTHCTQDAQKCADNVGVKEVIVIVAVCESETPRMCNCSMVGDPVLKQFDNSAIPLYPLSDGQECTLSQTPLMPSFTTDDYCGWEIEAYMTASNSTNGGSPTAVEVEIRYRAFSVDLLIEATGVTKDPATDVSNHNGGWYTVVTSGGKSTVHVAGCELTVTAENLTNHVTSRVEIIGPDNNSMTSAVGLCGNCNDLMDDYREADGNIVAAIGFFSAMTNSWCEA